jgi:hypothetical protein
MRIDKPYNLLLALIILLVGCLQAALFMYGLSVGNPILWARIALGGGAVVKGFVILFILQDQRQLRRGQHVRDVYFSDQVLCGPD